jgi:hypothetical protein
VQRLPEPDRRAADRGRADPERAEDLLLRRALRVEEAVVVALEHEAAAVHADDAMEHLRAELVAVVEDDVAGPVGRLRSDDGQIAAMELRLHRVADDDRVRGAAAELGRREEAPRESDGSQGGHGACDPGDTALAHAAEWWAGRT